MYSESCCFAHSTLSSMPSWDLCKMCGRPRQECFSWSILHAWIFWGTLLGPPPCPITFLKVRPCLFLNQVNKIVYSLLVELFRSLMYFNNTNGPRMEPCGTPQVTFFLLTFSYIYQFVFYWKGNFLFKHEICHENHRNKVNGYYDLPCQMLLVNQALTRQWVYVQWFLLSYQQVQLSHD